MNAAITLTEAAKRKLLALCERHDETIIRLDVRTRGCTGNSYHMDFARNIDPLDEVIALDDTKRLIIAAKAMMFVLGTEVDWVERGVESKFAFNNPSHQQTCGCGDSFL